MTAPILLVTLLLSGWILSLSRKGWVARALVTVSVPLGAFFGGYCGYIICRFLVFPFDGRPESQHNWIGWVDAGIIGAVIGIIFLPATVLALTGRKKRE
jgi:hypothetical protein